MSVDRVTFAEMQWCHEIGKEAARSYLSHFHDELKDDELERLLSVVESKPGLAKQTSSHYDKNRNKFVAAMWLAGASLRQLGLVFNTSPETMLRARDKGLGMHTGDRTKLRLVEPNLDYNRVLVMRDFCRVLARNNPAVVESLDVYVLAKTLEKMPDQTDEEKSAYNEPVVDNKVNNVPVHESAVEKPKIEPIPFEPEPKDSLSRPLDLSFLNDM